MAKAGIVKKRRLKVLLVFDSPYYTPRGYDFKKEFEEIDWMTEDDIYKALKECDYEVSLLGLYNDVTILLEEIKENKPDVVFNLTEVFKQKSHLDKNIVWLLEILDVPYTGATSTSLLICNNKALTKEILSFHKIHVPNFYTFYRDRRIKLLKRLKLPLIVKPLSEEASRGISQASVVDDESSLIERVKFIHQNMNTDAIVEEYIEGRELYVSVLGNRRVKVLPLREMKFGQFPEDEPRIATYKAKWDYNYRERWGIKNVFAGRLAEGLDKRIVEICKRAYRVLNMQCYARFDIRVTSSGSIYILEANANPCLAKYDELAQSAEKAGIPYTKLIQKIIKLALDRKR
jgi:D-alanine-D-alanine ligase